MNYKEFLLNAAFTFIVLGSVFNIPLAYSIVSEQPKPTPPNSILPQNDMLSGGSDPQVEVYKMIHYLERMSLQLESSYNISIPNPSFYEGNIRIDNLTVEMIENGDAEDNNLVRWVDEIDGTPDSSRVQRFNSTNAYDYVPSTQGDNYFLCFNASSFSTHWLVDYFANLSMPSRSTSLSFQYSNRFESLLSQQTNMDLHVRFDFVEFDIIFFLHTKVSEKFNYNTTIGNERYVHFLLNTTWSPNWIDVGPINLTNVLLSLDMYNATNLPPFFHLNRVLIECFAIPPYQFHLLMDNISLKTQVLPTQLGLLMNETCFSVTERNTFNLRMQGFTKGDLRFQLAVSNFSLVVPNKLTGHIMFDLLFRESLPLTYNFAYVNQTCVNWAVFFNITNKNPVLLPKTIEIRLPTTWSLYSLQNPRQEEVLQECMENHSANIDSVEFYGNLVLGNWYFAAYAPNYIHPLQISPTEVEQNSVVQLNLSLRSSLEQPVVIFLLREEGDVIYFKTSQFASLDGILLLNIPIGNDFPKGNYTLTARISAGFCGGIQYTNITVSTRPALLTTEVPQFVSQYEQLIISVQMIDLSTRLRIAAEFFYAWDGNNDSINLGQSDDNSPDSHFHKFRIDITGISPGNHSLTLEGRSPGYSTARITLNVTIIPSILFIELDCPEKACPNDIVVFKVRVVNNVSHPAPEMDVHLRIDGLAVKKSKTDRQGYSLMIWEVPTNVSHDIFVEIIIFQHDKMIGMISRNIQIEQRDLHDTELRSAIWGDSSIFFISVSTFVLSSIIAVYRHRRSRYIILFGEEIPKE